MCVPVCSVDRTGLYKEVIDDSPSPGFQDFKQDIVVQGYQSNAKSAGKDFCEGAVVPFE